ncbi:MAG: efflux RND transporter permease subunit [Gammaproteobacteria bacterium]|nr:efflux RND transporter permease subunit [Gammaproteobacteria bacterium]MBU1556620.1 efflux RND transporter permease subunit [Gammaproteobacteria bacterium]MBU2069775.1 efflux RND transporter permease subunit [Gammaproteobacteria bacterium]MBU2184640.1 efflux RND transporter permease subunit [Gammaproteobacteria bacterium]MBU2205694.1 efflux RND transporter permease subunit [Gammaproteobacteria bacterium]
MSQQPLWLTRFALTRPVTICMLFLSMLVFGIIASRMLPLEKFPGIDIPQIFINVPYNNATPTEIERLITRPVEEALATVSGVKEMRSWSNENSAEISLEFNWEENINSKSIEVRERLDSIRHLLPDDVERVLVFQFNTNDMPIFQLRISSERDLAMAYDLLERQIKRPLERVAGVSKVELYGVEKRQVIIRLDPDKMRALNIDAPSIVRTLQSNNFAMTAGELRNSENSILIKPVGEYQQLEQIAALPLRPGLSLREVATVQLELPEREDGRHLDQTYAVGMNVFKESGANLVEVARAALAVVEAADKDPAFSGISLYIMDDMADGVTTSLSDLLSAGGIGALLSFAVLYLFLRHIGTTMVVVLAVPVSICIALGIMYFLDYSLNILSMMGLMLAIGMLVDNAVVVTESIFRERALGGDVKAATARGVRRVSLAVVAGTATTAIVFLPNIVGQKMELTIFLEHVAIAICLCLAVSLLMALTLIPLLTTYLHMQPQQQHQTGAFERGYRKVLGWVMYHPRWSTLIAVLLLVSIAIPMGAVSSGDEDNEDRDRIFLNYNIQGNFALEEVEAEVSSMEAYLYANKEQFDIESVYSYYRSGHAISIIILKPQLSQPMAALKEAIRKDWPALVRAKPSFGWGNNGGMQVHLLGSSTEVLLKLAEDIEPMLSGIAGLEDVSSEMARGQQEVQIRLKLEQLQRHGLSAQQVAQAVALALRGTNLRTFRTLEQGELLMRVLYDEKISHSQAELAALPILNKDGVVISLQQLATLTIAPRLNQIRRFDRQTGIAIRMNLAKDYKMDTAREDIKKVMDQLALPAGYRWSFQGSFQRQDESQQVMVVNMLLAVAMIYLVMAALFESLLLPTAVIGSLLFSLVGVFWTFLFTGTTMGVMGMIGMLVLMGIVVNNGIVLVDRINQDRQEQPDATLRELIINASESRLRPILMTVSTTVLGLLPLALGGTQIGGDGPSYAPMAIAIIGGLLFSTLTSLVLVPLTYWGLVKLTAGWASWRAQSLSWADKLIKSRG